MLIFNHSRQKRPGGFREFFSIAYPLIISNLSITLMTFIDRLFLSWSSPEEIAAALPAGILLFTLCAYFLGVSEYSNTFVAQFYGAKRYKDVGKATWQGIWFAVASGFITLLFLPLGGYVFRWVGHAPEVVALEEIYYFYYLFAMIFLVINAAIGSFYSGRGKTKVIMSISIVSNLLNAILDYALIFGAWGFPQWGIKGAAVATMIATIFATFLYLFFFLSKKNDLTYSTRHNIGIDWELMRRLFRFGSPSGMEFLLTIGSFTAFIMMIGQLGTIELAASNIVLALNMLAFFPMVGAGVATSTLVGQYIGRRDFSTAERSAYTSLVTVQAYMIAFALIYYLFPRELIMIFHDPNPDTILIFDDIVAYGSRILLLVAVYQIFDAMIITFSGALRGAGDTRFAMWASVVCSWFFFVPGTWLVLHTFQLGVISAWVWATLYIALLGLVYLIRFRSGYWKSIQVIPMREKIATSPID